MIYAGLQATFWATFLADCANACKPIPARIAVAAAE
jgi:hypothetical protein